MSSDDDFKIGKAKILTEWWPHGMCLRSLLSKRPLRRDSRRSIQLRVD